MAEKVGVSEIVITFSTGSQRITIQDARNLYVELQALFGEKPPVQPLLVPTVPIVLERQWWPQWWDPNAPAYTEDIQVWCVADQTQGTTSLQT